MKKIHAFACLCLIGYTNNTQASECRIADQPIDSVNFPTNTNPEQIPSIPVDRPIPIPITSITMKVFRNKLRTMNCEILQANFFENSTSKSFDVTEKIQAFFKTDQSLRIKLKMQQALKKNELSTQQQALIDKGNYFALALYFEADVKNGILSIRVRMSPRDKTNSWQEFEVRMPDSMLKLKKNKKEKKNSNQPQTEIIVEAPNEDPEIHDAQ